MTQIKMTSIKQIHDALKQGKTVYWANKSYEVKQRPIRKDFVDHDLNHETQIDGMLLDCRCVSNYFGGLLNESEVSSCFIEE